MGTYRRQGIVFTDDSSSEFETDGSDEVVLGAVDTDEDEKKEYISISKGAPLTPEPHNRPTEVTLKHHFRIATTRYWPRSTLPVKHGPDSATIAHMCLSLTSFPTSLRTSP